MTAFRWCLTGAMIVAVPASAQQLDTVRLDEVVVTATRVPVERSSVPARVQVIHGDRILAVTLTGTYM